MYYNVSQSKVGPGNVQWAEKSKIANVGLETKKKNPK